MKIILFHSKIATSRSNIWCITRVQTNYPMNYDDYGRTLSTTGACTGVTTTCSYADSADPVNAGRLKWEENADGTASQYSYAENNGELTLTEAQGAGDRSGVNAGTVTVSVYNIADQLIEETISDIESGLTLSNRVADAGQGFHNLGRPQKWHPTPTATTWPKPPPA